jgi:hypothetical protein
MMVADIMDILGERHSASIDRHSKFSCGLEIVDVARGDVDLFLIPRAGNWDYAAPSLILQQAGGRSYFARNPAEMGALKPWKLQLENPGAYYPAFFTNRAIDAEFKRVIRGLTR